jgi:hypothetical protein
LEIAEKCHEKCMWLPGTPLQVRKNYSHLMKLTSVFLGELLAAGEAHLRPTAPSGGHRGEADLDLRKICHYCSRSRAVCTEPITHRREFDGEFPADPGMQP